MKERKTLGWTSIGELEIMFSFVERRDPRAMACLPNMAKTSLVNQPVTALEEAHGPWLSAVVAYSTSLSQVDRPRSDDDL
jgi:hypothetical protein